ncbi:unnamed protein product [Paramecium sonneborni]|uniref:Uncharacterized protein n=1 Tax=Paramecium sonneborni TaxID=65129 RepID=A0A8S1PDB7_9CILI|nr:unnamed protein product [Paramecium sonneborni]
MVVNGFAKGNKLKNVTNLTSLVRVTQNTPDIKLIMIMLEIEHFQSLLIKVSGILVFIIMEIYQGSSIFYYIYSS